MTAGTIISDYMDRTLGLGYESKNNKSKKPRNNFLQAFPGIEYFTYFDHFLFHLSLIAN